MHHIAFAFDCPALSPYLTDVVEDDPRLNGDRFSTIEQRLIVMVVICVVGLLLCVFNNLNSWKIFHIVSFDNLDTPYSGHANVFLDIASASCPVCVLVSRVQHFRWSKDEENLAWNLSAY